jgi:NAD(P)-dependent dehydrogenase (short-subunit alcohol dehydrogenase family)
VVIFGGRSEIGLQLATRLAPGATVILAARGADRLADEVAAVIPGAALVRGRNVLAAQLHQARAADDDLAFGCALTARISADALPPALSLHEIGAGGEGALLVELRAARPTGAQALELRSWHATLESLQKSVGVLLRPPCALPSGRHAPQPGRVAAPARDCTRCESAASQLLINARSLYIVLPLGPDAGASCVFAPCFARSSAAIVASAYTSATGTSGCYRHCQCRSVPVVETSL